MRTGYTAATWADVSDTGRVTDTPCGKSHEPAPAQISQVEPAAAIAEDCDGEVNDLWLANARVLELDLDRPELVDVRIEDCDISGIVAGDFIVRRLEVRQTRLRGVTFATGQLDDGLLDDCNANELSLRFSRLRRVIFHNCDLSGADFYSASFDHVTIDDCNLQRAHFDAATVKCLAITNCDLTGVTGAFGLKGAQLDASDVPSLAISLAREAGIDLRDA
jgi:uncharacterized protein YjbI with pentapeptide repeats